MANPLIGMMGSGAPARATVQAPDLGMIKQAAQSAKRMMGMLSAVKNPQQALLQAAQQNPQLNAIMQLIGNRNPQEVFYEECQKHGINPNEVMNMLKG